MRQRVEVKKLADLDERVAPGFANLWRAVKKSTGTRVRCPKSVLVTDEPWSMCPNDSSCARRFAVDLATMKVLGERHVSCGEWAMANKGQDRAVVDIPAGQAVVSCEWNDYYRFFSMTVEVAPGTLAPQVTGGK